MLSASDAPHQPLGVLVWPKSGRGSSRNGLKEKLNYGAGSLNDCLGEPHRELWSSGAKGLARLPQGVWNWLGLYLLPPLAIGSGLPQEGHAHGEAALKGSS